ncbi:hypothetical protein Fleli_1734 [Bernardetia litoralis DSM 6794]|uniref:ATPase n=1 Tax=Bernardetia litoralis (strain ATCC 23117 / DSM 6794 / NBRC 15988 / NCIMB 1366 / Fx l1 / Sio-4) TaxID=880071 RepID=I4AJJ9_BERLS|nr:DUF4175 family protein [Bernardetia litoralis]AFM04134.1 hypothetical protein Fleli_1734 [Bernardetia litoralis DSM 6794]
MNTSIEALYANIQSYKRKYYKNLLLKGSLLAISAFLGAFAIVSILEYFGNFSSTFRAVLFYSFISVSIFSLVYWVIIPIYQLFTLDKQLPHNEAAKQIGRYFPQVEDRLLNVLQLHSTNNKNFENQSSDLYQASIEQKASQFAPISFSDAIEYEQNRRYLRFLFIPIVLIAAFLVWDMDFYKASAVRLVNYEQDFAPKAPFQFSVDTKQLIAFKGEDLNFDVNLSGEAFPNEVFLISDNGRKVKLDKNSASSYSYQFTNIQRPFEFSLDGEGYTSKMYEIIVRERPQLRNFVAYLNYPNYTGKKDERQENTGNLIVPAGTQIEWRFQTQETEKLNFVSIVSDDSTNIKTAKKEEDGFLLQTMALSSEAFEIELENKYSKNKEKISYLLTVIQDEFPKVSLNQFQDSVMYDYLMLGGNISDDYGITNLRFNYRITSNKKTSEYKSLPLKFNPNAINQQYFHQVELAPLELKAGDELEYFVQVWDNDGVRGNKSSKTGSYRFQIPKESEMRESVTESSKNTESQMDKTLEEAQDLNKKIKKLAEDLKGKKKLSWQQKKELEKLLEDKKQLEEDIKKMQEQNKKLNEQQEKFTEQDERIAEKSKKLQELMDELMDEKTKELYDKLQELLQEQTESEEIKEVLEKLQNKEMNLEKELDRTLEMFKKLEVDKKMQDLAEQLEDLAKEQKDLAKETEKQQEKEDKQSKKEAEKDAEKDAAKNEEIKEEQKELNEKFEEMKEQMEELDKMNEELKTPKDLEDTKKKEEEVSEEQEQSSEQLEQKEKKKAAQSQENAGEKMEEMAQQMQQMTSSAEMEQAQEDYDDLRQLLENLLKLSFEQEEVMNGFNEIDQRDPKYITLSQDQLKLKDDAQIVEDSLRALAKRVMQIETFVMRELTDMNDYMAQVTQEVKDRKNPRLLANHQQSVMTSINNLALMLNDVLEQMQQSMSQMGMGKPKPSNQSGSPSMGEMQQSINQQIENLKKSGKSGRQLSEGLAKIAAEQEALRRALQKAMKQGKDGKDGKGKEGKEGKDGQNGDNGEGDGGSQGNGGNMSQMIKDMEKTEEDLVNKRLTQELIERQKQIMTRLLESEKAEKERDLDEKREAEQAKANKRTVPPQFEEYFKQKEQQIELLKTIPPALSPYYKQQVNEYFKKLEE